MHVPTTAAVEGGRERGTSGQWKTTEKVTKKCTHTHTHTHTHARLSCPVYRLSYNGHATLIDEEAKSKHLTLGVLIMFYSCTTSVHCYPSLAQEPNDHSLYIALSHADIPLVVPSLMPCSVTGSSEPSLTYLALHWPRWSRWLSSTGSGGGTSAGRLLGTTPMYCQASNAAEPAAAAGALHSTTLFPHWLLSVSSTFVPCSVALPTEASPTHWALHLALWLDNMWLLLVTMFQPLAIGLMPACSGEGCHIPLLFWNPHSFQVPANQVSPSPLGPPCGRGWGSHPNSVCLGMRWSGIRAKCLSHSSLRFTTLKLVSTVSKSPHCSLVIIM